MRNRYRIGVASVSILIAYSESARNFTVALVRTSYFWMADAEVRA